MDDVTVIWATSASSVATVDAEGVVTATGNGTATITASAGSALGDVVVTVTQALASVEVSPSAAELTAWDATVQLTAAGFDANGHRVKEAAFMWESTDALVATIDTDGLVTATGNGTAIISASAGSIAGAVAVTVTQAVASVEVSPSAAELTEWGATVQLTAKAFDANWHTVQGAAFTWGTVDEMVATVDAAGVVSGIGEGVATVTASSGTASGFARVTVPPTFTLSGTVRDSRENGPMLAGAVVRLETDKRRESIVVGHGGRFHIPGVWGTVTVRVIGAPTHRTETVEITLDEDRTLDFYLEHRGAPPYSGSVSPLAHVIQPSDPTKLGSITYAGRGERRVFDRRPATRITINAYLFDVRFDEHMVEFRVNPEFGSKEAAQAEVETYGHVLGQMPAVLLSGIMQVTIHLGDELWGGLRGSGVLIHTGWLSRVANMEETFFHEAGHAALDLAHMDSPGWLAAQEADGVFISRYAQNHPRREDIAESFLAYFALRYQPERLTFIQQALILRTMPNRLKYFDEQGFDMGPYEPSEARQPPEEIVTIEGKVIGPDEQPVEGILLWAWARRVEDSGFAFTGQDGSFAIAVPDSSFTLNVHILGRVGRECTHVGWHGPGGFTAVRGDATRIEVDGESVVDIVVRLPDHPDVLPCV